MKKGYLIVGIALWFALVFTQKGLADDEILEGSLTRAGQKYVPDEIIVKFKPGIKEDAIANLNSKHGTSVFYTSRRAGFRRLRISRKKTVSEMVQLYKKDPNVEYAEPNYIAYAFWAPNDPYYKYQWHMNNPVYGGINTEEAWQLTSGDRSVIVAVIDTGVAYEDYSQIVGRRRINYYRASDLAQTSFVPGYDFVNDDSHPNDDNGHGTHVTGTIAQSTNNGIGVAGVAFSCSIMPVKVLDKYGSGTYADVAEGIIWAADHGAKVINMSLGGADSSTTLENACAHAYNNGATIICAAGNDGQPNVSYPAAYDAYCIAVGATRYDETRAYYSNYGNSLDLVAPGGDLKVDQNGDGYVDGVLQQTFGTTTNDWGYWFFQGTSMAAPHVSGVAALLISYRVATTLDEVRAALQSTAKDLGTQGFDPEYGWGRVDAYAALKWTPGPDTTPPVISNGKPTGIINNNTLIRLSVITNEPATCEGSIDADKDYETMDLLFTSDAAGTSHACVLINALTDGPHTVYVKGKDTVGNITPESYKWSFTVDTTAPAKVQGVSVSTVSSSQLNISWTNNSETDLDHYNIYRSTASGFVPSPENLIASSAVNSYSNVGLSPSTTYYYRVTAVDKVGNKGAASDEVAGTTAQAPAKEDFTFTGTVGPRGENRHSVNVKSGAKNMYVKLTWSQWDDLRLRIYDPTGKKVAEVDKSTPTNKVEEATINTPVEGLWRVAAYSENNSRSISYQIQVTVNY